MQKLLIATSNLSKVAEYRELLHGLPIEIVSASDLNISAPEETGSTLEENALLKARMYRAASGLPVIADDGGMEIDALGGAPGIYGKRWVNGTEDVTDEEIVAHTLKQLQGVSEEKRTARMPIVIAFIDAEGHEHTARGEIVGRITEEAHPYPPGFPYRGIFFVPRFNKLYGELTHEEHAAMGHRQLAFQKLLPIIKRAFSV